MKKLEKLNNKNKIDIESLSNFFLEKEDVYLDMLLQKNDYKQITDFTSDNFFNYILQKPFSADILQKIPKILFKDSNYINQFIDRKINNVFLYIPIEYLNEEICIRFVKNGLVIHVIPEQFRTFKLFIEDLISFGKTDVAKTIKKYFGIYSIPKTMNNYNYLVKIIMKKYPLTFEYILDNEFKYLLSYDVFKTTYQSLKEKILTNYDYRNVLQVYNKWYIEYLPKEYIIQLKKDFPEDEDLQNYNLNENKMKMNLLSKKLLKESTTIPEVKNYLNLVKNNPNEIKNVPIDILNQYPIIAIEAIKLKPYCLKYIPEDIDYFYTLCEIAVTTEPEIIDFVPLQLRDFNIFKKAIETYRKNGNTFYAYHLIHHMPKNMAEYNQLIELLSEITDLHLLTFSSDGRDFFRKKSSNLNQILKNLYSNSDDDTKKRFFEMLLDNRYNNAAFKNFADIITMIMLSDTFFSKEPYFKKYMWIRNDPKKSINTNQSFYFEQYIKKEVRKLLKESLIK